jgi:hypothetical protein
MPTQVTGIVVLEAEGVPLTVLSVDGTGPNSKDGVGTTGCATSMEQPNMLTTSRE